MYILFNTVGNGRRQTMPEGLHQGHELVAQFYGVYKGTFTPFTKRNIHRYLLL